KNVEPKSKLILVTAINPTASGEGKTTVSIGLADGMAKLGKKVCLALREPSLGPVFGIKGGAAGGGYAQVVPMADINLHFTGDLHAITSANNLLCAMIDNHIFRGNTLKIKQVTFRRCMDMNDRALRDLTIKCEAGKMVGCESYSRQEGFEITAASEVMAILCLARDLADLKKRIGEIVVGVDENGNFVRAKQLNADGAMATLLKDAIKPNLVQTLEGTPAIVHGGPFANIAHGCNSVRATYTAMTLADYTVTEAGFGADLGAEKFLDAKCRIADIQPDCVVVVATVKALKLHGGADKANLSEENIPALKSGVPNLLKHVENVKKVFNKPCVVAMNRFATDSEKEIETVLEACKKAGAKVVFTDVFLKGGEGGKDLAQAVIEECGKKSKLKYAYELKDGIVKKIESIVKKVYGGNGAEFSQTALEKIKSLENAGIKNLPVIIAKTQYSLSDDPKKLSAPTGFKIFVRDIIYKGGAGFIVAVAGDIMLMPGLGKIPSAEHIDVDKDGNITGLS
ncbi:MAG: formate--tetrahydrofolate ligase, partial [Clostridia bacterium]|nr:formate--tetrahydrofolate ligase [Clostridia bacterium]